MTEREQIVAWLLGQADEMGALAGKYGERGLWDVAASYDQQAKLHRHIADAIERGEHIKDQSDG